MRMRVTVAACAAVKAKGSLTGQKTEKMRAGLHHQNTIKISLFLLLFQSLMI